MTPPKFSPTRRILLWGLLLAALSLMDLALTTIALEGVQGAVELNPIAAHAFEQGFLTAALLKLVGLEVILLLAIVLSRSSAARTAERVLAAWCVILLVVNAWSALQVLGGA